MIIKNFEDFLNEERKGLWHNIRAKRARGEKPSRKGSKAYKKAVKAAKEINETYKSIGLGDPVDYNNRISYEIDPKILSIYWTDHSMSGKEVVEFIIVNCGLESGEIFIDTEEFIVTGITKRGNNVFVSQNGEYDMYGGTYDPKMEKPTVTVNGKDILQIVIQEFEKCDEEEYDKNYPDMTRMEIYGYLLNSKETLFTSKRYGLA